MNIIERVQTLRQTIAKTALHSQRPPESITLLAVSKGQSVKAMQAAFQAGIRDFGENYWQEAKFKIDALKTLSVCWHFIGAVQSNKTLAIASNFTWVHSINNEKIAQLLNMHRPSQLPPLNVCIQVNLDNEKTKSGISPQALPELAYIMKDLPRLKLRGLMAIPKMQPEEEQQYKSFLRLSQLMYDVNRTINIDMDTLSMGMSEDFIAAIRAGSTLIRIGRALFGDRK